MFGRSACDRGRLISVKNERICAESRASAEKFSGGGATEKKTEK